MKVRSGSREGRTDAVCVCVHFAATSNGYRIHRNLPHKRHHRRVHKCKCNSALRLLLVDITNKFLVELHPARTKRFTTIVRQGLAKPCCAWGSEQRLSGHTGLRRDAKIKQRVTHPYAKQMDTQQETCCAPRNSQRASAGAGAGCGYIRGSADPQN